MRSSFGSNDPLHIAVQQFTAVLYQTTPPSIGHVSTTAADGVPRGVAGLSQTIDVYGSPGPIASGGFRLSYGHDDGIGGSGSSSSTTTTSSIFTPCIPADSTVLTADVVALALTSANGFVTVAVTEDDSPFDDARRFVVDFDAPALGVGTLGVVAPDDDCEWLQCNDGGIGDCDESSVVVNRDASVAVQEGAVEVWLVYALFVVGSRQVVERNGVDLPTEKYCRCCCFPRPPIEAFVSILLVQVVLYFTVPVSVDTALGSPTLLLRVDPTTTDAAGLRSAEHIPGLTQFVDVGVDASR